MHGIELHWLPKIDDWAAQLASLEALPPSSVWAKLVHLASHRITAIQTLQLDRRLGKLAPANSLAGQRPVRLAILAATTIDHLLPAIRVGCLRRSIAAETYTPHYGLYAQDLLDPDSAFHRFRPTVVLFALDAPHLLQAIRPEMTRSAVEEALERTLDQLERHWAIARRNHAQVIQNVPLPVFTPLMGNNEDRLPGSRVAALRRLSALLRDRAERAGVDLIALGDWAATDGLAQWHDPALWHRAKQEIHPQAAPLYGDHVARVIAAAQGRSSKCLVLDLDNTLWGGVIGDDGLAGIKLGQGSARGEAHLAFQSYIRDLSARGVILAVCSKNDEANAFEPFDRHPEMLLKREDIACFVANWDNKAANLRLIAERLNIGIDSLVFADDNPAERAIVRRELPTVAVPELPEDPTFYADCIASGGYFEALRLTAEDAQRASLYRSNAARATLSAQATDMAGYLASLRMRAIWGHFSPETLARVVQLINKTNQFNLTTLRMTDAEASSVAADPAVLAIQLRLVDQFGDNGIVAVVTGRFEAAKATVYLDRWLMSCRVLGRGAEDATLNLVAAEARRLGAHHLVGEFRPSAKNGMVREHYARLGFDLIDETDGCTTWNLDLDAFEPLTTFITCERVGGTVPQSTPARVPAVQEI